MHKRGKDKNGDLITLYMDFKFGAENNSPSGGATHTWLLRPLFQQYYHQINPLLLLNIDHFHPITPCFVFLFFELSLKTCYICQFQQQKNQFQVEEVKFVHKGKM